MSNNDLDELISGYTGSHEIKVRLDSWIKNLNCYRTMESDLAQQISDLEADIPEGETGMGIDLLNQELTELENRRQYLLTGINQMECCCQNLLTDFSSEQKNIIEEIKVLTDNYQVILSRIEHLREHNVLRDMFFNNYPTSLSDQSKKIYLKKFFHIPFRL